MIIPIKSIKALNITLSKPNFVFLTTKPVKLLELLKTVKNSKNNDDTTKIINATLFFMILMLSYLFKYFTNDLYRYLN